MIHKGVLTIETQGTSIAASLPDVLARLGAGDELEFPALRPHQAHPWHAFLVQLGALVVARSGDPELDRSAEDWRRGLLALAGDGGEDAWTLVVDDPARPAFMQVPVPEGAWRRYKPAAETPDDLDMLVTAKNHDVKQHTMVAARTEHWLYSLVTLQTFQGFSGRGNYGVARMNSGFGSRPGLAAAPGLGWAERFARDVGVWLATREELLGTGYDYHDRGPALLWTLAWDGTRPRLPLEQCDPFFIEVCRRVRLIDEGGRLVTWGAPSDKAFLDAKSRQGDTGDIWTPIQATDQGSVALTVSPSGLTYRKLQEVIFGGDWGRQPALRVREEDGDRPLLVAQVMPRGQGKTEGYHQRLIPLAGKSVGWLRSASTRSLLGALAKARVELVGEVQRRLLRPALCALLQGGPDDLNLRDDRPQRWLDHLDQAVDAIFFTDLWHDFATAEDDPEAADAHWEERLYRLASAQLEDAIRNAAIPEARNYRAVATATMIFEGAARKNLTRYFPPTATDQGASDERAAANV